MTDEQYQDYLTGGGIVPASFSMEGLSLGDCDPLPLLSWREFGAWLLRRRSRYRIAGDSMQPLLKPGDEVLYCPQVYEKISPKIGEVVIVLHPYQAGLVMIKRIGAIEEADAGSFAGGARYFLLGDNRAASTDSRSFGWVRRAQLVGVVTCCFTRQ